MERLGYILILVGIIGLAFLLVYGIYISAGTMPALIVLFFELIGGGIALTAND